MGGSVGEVVAQLLKARGQLAAAAVTANRAKVDAEQAAALYRAAGRGSEHRLLKAAVADVGVAGDKSDKVARLINEIGEQIAKYVNHIAPGSAPATVDAMPSGERLVDEASRAANRARRMSRRAAKNAENAGDIAKKLVEYFQAARPAGTVTTTQTPTWQPTIKTPTGLPAEGAQSLAVAAAAMLAAAMKAAAARRERKDRRDDG
jgi:hypothetical protein